jgi:probable DNA metabolism protein
MLQIVYDGSMAGLLTAVFEAYERRAQGETRIVAGQGLIPDVFASRVDIPTDFHKARRVWKGLQRQLSPGSLDHIWSCYLSELPEKEDMILAFVRYVFDNPGRRVDEDFGHPAVLWTAQTARRVWREKHRMEAFVRFQELGDGMYYAVVDPDFDVLPLIARHFRSRYADQRWLIYDSRRKKGLHYDPESEALSDVNLELREGSKGAPEAEALSRSESWYQLLWKDYFKSTGIDARKNPALHLRHVPHRYWKNLIEKQG